MHRNDVVDWAVKQARELVLQYDHPKRTMIATEIARRIIEAYDFGAGSKKLNRRRWWQKS
jgi:hypothetical protein